MYKLLKFTKTNKHVTNLVVKVIRTWVRLPDSPQKGTSIDVPLFFIEFSLFNILY